MNIPSIQLRPYQREAVAAIEHALARGIRRQVIAMPTGTGKTLVFSECIHRRHGRALIVAHRDELIHQAAEKYRQVDPTADVGIVKADQDEHHAEVVVASVQTLARENRRERLTPDFTTVVIDEAQHAVADSYVRVLEHVRAFEDDGPLVLGVSATPERGDGMGLDDIFEAVTYERSLLEMIEAGYLVDLRAIQVRVQADLNSVHVRRGDLAADELSDVLTEANAPTQVAQAYREHASDRTGLVFTPSVQLAHETALALNDVGIIAAAIDGRTETETRREILTRLSTGAVQVVVNCNVLTEGFDEPSVEALVVARPTRSQPLYIQMIGRGTRLHPGKSDCLVLDLVGATDRHDLQTTTSLFGLEPGDLTDFTVMEAVQQRARTEAAPVDGPLVAKPVTLFGRHSLNWVSISRTRHALSVPGGTLVLRSTDGRTWRVTHARRNRQREILGDGLTLSYAQGIAEDTARELNANQLVKRSARWRRDRATSGQLLALQRWGIQAKTGLSKGEASDLLTSASAQVAS